MGLGLAKLAEEDPTFRVYWWRNWPNHYFWYGWVSPWIIIDRLKREHNVEAILVHLRSPTVKTIRGTAEAQGKHITIRWSWSIRWRLDIWAKWTGKGSEFIDMIKGGVVPQEYCKPVQQGGRNSNGGVIAGYPVVDIKATLFTMVLTTMGNDSSELAF